MLSHASLSPGFDFEELARRTDGLSGSDLKETCRNAAMIPVRELMRERGGTGIKGMEEAKKEVCPLVPYRCLDLDTNAIGSPVAGLPTAATEDV